MKVLSWYRKQSLTTGTILEYVDITVSLFNGGQQVSLTTDVIFAWFR